MRGGEGKAAVRFIRDRRLPEVCAEAMVKVNCSNIILERGQRACGAAGLLLAADISGRGAGRFIELYSVGGE